MMRACDVTLRTPPVQVLDAIKTKKYNSLAAKAPTVVSALSDTIAPHKKMGVFGV